ncbi:PPC domain-containing protein [Falsirhodobacter sp. 20TX0035]|uniref:PPC domain-containing protein n=1 Tax=Falsirhodobacter sp. 20TX0035 TaxID=3022019 RepID=UPI00232EB1E9|nr:PPC domain-containing protein [Falsirhodobacter sp. 20TX0035]MDB6452889.1 PPC domain-containing protein [Falsirhodobacter sp. 20TX0035]
MIRVVGPSALVLCALAAPALAQDAPGTCGQPAVLSQPAGVAIAPGFADLSLILRPERSEPRYVEFEVTAPTEITLETLARENDAALTLYDAEGRVVAWDDDSAGDLDARVATTLGAGRYCAQVRMISAAPVDDPMLVLVASEGLPPNPATAVQEEVVAVCNDPVRTPMLADNLPAGAVPPMEGTIDPATSLRSFRIAVTEPTVLQIDAGSQTFDTMLAVYGADGAGLWENDDHEDVMGSDSRIREAFEPGEYCVVVRPFGTSEGPFTLSVTAGDAPN